MRPRLRRRAPAANYAPRRICAWLWSSLEGKWAPKTEGRAYSIEEAVSKYAATISARLKSKIALGDDGRSILLVHINDEQLPPEGLPALLEQARVAATGSPFAATVLVGSSDEKQICELIAGSISEL